MITYWKDQFDNKKIVILGFGKEGISTYRFINSITDKCLIQIMDQNIAQPDNQVQEIDTSIYFYPKERYLDFDKDVDLVFKSPGIPLMHIKGLIELDKVTSQSNEFIKVYKDRIVGITGTKGKSTVSTLIYELLKGEGMNVELIGNIGKPPFDYVLEKDPSTFFVYELSSHQLETVRVSPKYGIILNIFQEHLDHYASYDHYAEAKMNIGRYQCEEDTLIYSALDEEIPKRLDGYKGKLIPITKDEAGRAGLIVTPRGIDLIGDFNTVHLDQNLKRHLLGDHNLINIGVAVYITLLLGYNQSKTREKVIETFPGLPHRLAFVARVNGVDFYNDSISTIPQATIAAVKALGNVDSVIIGGMDRGVDYGCLVDYINNNEKIKVILLPTTGHQQYSRLKHPDRLFLAKDMEEAVAMGMRITVKDSICLLSPAAASYGVYKNFESRGRHFESLVKHLL
ncbi:UDP-N-acetylmuramoyl-L-alanine--D-glutamate ligase [Petrocella sp. FN5]|uniref:UDP-N-acetylmuramoyl-L-alanine--D-glutamate ligase n=1 Tax=Petrocella sp. FN5 TaxID=3032002 RepID=UPI0023DB4F6E|nr:UDP-N-acetylmuramoyl-L-alanine--D-glutamate ligase [Petrocella sp. FN5]MDF1617857.1 UDP-N-acetylmuramoyl-L-alanine--D-glutamate ligase [Petrocella sp. FN5]